MRKTGMKVRLYIDCIGSLVMYPISKEWNKRISDYLASWGEEWSCVYVQNDIEETLSDLVSPRQLQDLYNGWPVVVLIDPWVFGQGFIGYDAGDRGYIPLS